MKVPRLAPLMLAVFALTGCQGTVVPNDQEPPAGDILIASDLPITGFFPDAIPAERAIQLAIRQHPTVGRFKLAYWSLDDAVAGNNSLEKGIQNVSRLVDVAEVLGMIGPYTSSVAAVAIPIANTSDLAMISPANTRLCLTQLGPNCPYSAATLHPSGHINYFRIAPPDATQGLAMARYAVGKLGLKRVAVINQLGAGGDIIVQRFQSELQRLGGSVVAREDPAPGIADFKEFLSQAHDSHSQAIYAVGDDDVCAARGQMSDDELFLGTDYFGRSNDCITKMAGRTTSVFATRADVDITVSADPDAIKAVRAFRKAYPHSDIPSYTFASYDCAQILIAAIQQAVNDDHGNLPNRRQVLDAVAQIQFKGVTGTYAFDSNGDAKAPLMEMLTIENGQWVDKGKIDATAAPA
jgi:branched-chain amino acid transport system substrate-binding protein